MYLENILTKFNNIVSPIFCNQLAKKTRFVQRSTSKISGHEFARSMMVPNGFIEGESLNSLAERMNDINEDCNLSASGLSQRINSKGAESFMKAYFAITLREIIKNDFECLSDLKEFKIFNRILIEDSTKAELNQKLSSRFKGNGGSASISALKLDFIFEYLSEQFVDIEIFSGNIPDQKIANRINHFLKKNDLVLRDLGYYAIERLKEIEEKEAFYISRLKSTVDVFESKESEKPLNLASFLSKKMVRGIKDVKVFIGKEKHPVRLVACKVSDEVVVQRLVRANRTAKQKGNILSQRKIDLLRYSIFITNIPLDILSSKPIMATYRARWRIELIFKQWKSCLKLHLFKGSNEYRINCFLYGRLIMILLLSAIYPILYEYAIELGRELSTIKVTKYIIADDRLAKAFKSGKLDEFSQKIVKDIPRRLCMDKRKKTSLRANVKLGKYYFKELELNGL